MEEHQICDDIFTFGDILKARMKVKVTCVGFPNKKFPDRMVRGWEYVENVSKRKKTYNVELLSLYLN